MLDALFKLSLNLTLCLLMSLGVRRSSLSNQNLYLIHLTHLWNFRHKHANTCIYPLYGLWPPLGTNNYFQFKWISNFLVIILYLLFQHFEWFFQTKLISFFFFVFSFYFHIHYRKIFRFYRQCHRIVHVKSTICASNVGNATRVTDRSSVKFIYSYNEKIWATNQRICCSIKILWNWPTERRRDKLHEDDNTLAK